MMGRLVPGVWYSMIILNLLHPRYCHLHSHELTSRHDGESALSDSQTYAAAHCYRCKG